MLRRFAIVIALTAAVTLVPGTAQSIPAHSTTVTANTPYVSGTTIRGFASVTALSNWSTAYLTIQLQRASCPNVCDWSSYSTPTTVSNSNQRSLSGTDTGGCIGAIGWYVRTKGSSYHYDWNGQISAVYTDYGNSRYIGTSSC